MRRWLLGLVVVLPALVSLYACGGAQPAPSGPGGDVCPVLDAGPPPVCPEGCTWDGEACRKHSGIIMPDARDGGSPIPVPSTTSP
jgi:hypothetical protein